MTRKLPLSELTALGKGATLAAATEVATTTAAEFDFAAGLALLIESHIVVGFQSDDNDRTVELVRNNHRAWPGIDSAPRQIRRATAMMRFPAGPTIGLQACGSSIDPPPTTYFNRNRATAIREGGAW